MRVQPARVYEAQTSDLRLELSIFSHSTLAYYATQ